MDVLIIVNDGPYGNEKPYNALRLAMAIQKDPSSVQVNLFLMADAVHCALPNQTTAQGYYNIERMLKSIVSKGGQIKACGTCADARGISALQLIEGVEIGNMAELTRWVLESDKVVTF